MNLEERLGPTLEASSAPVPGVIENPVINSPYEEPLRHFVFDNEGITNQTAEGRRVSTFFIPIAPPKRKEPQLQTEAMMTPAPLRPNAPITPIPPKPTLRPHTT